MYYLQRSYSWKYGSYSAKNCALNIIKLQRFAILLCFIIGDGSNKQGEGTQGEFLSMWGGHNRIVPGLGAPLHLIKWGGSGTIMKAKIAFSAISAALMDIHLYLR